MNPAYCFREKVEICRSASAAEVEAYSEVTGTFLEDSEGSLEIRMYRQNLKALVVPALASRAP